MVELMGDDEDDYSPGPATTAGRPPSRPGLTSWRYFSRQFSSLQVEWAGAFERGNLSSFF